MSTRQQPRSFTYRIPLDDRQARRKVNRLDSLHDGYHIHKIHTNNVPNGKAIRHWGAVFYKSIETRDFETDEMQGGTIPGLHKYRYSLEWEPTPETELLEMRNANGGGTKIKGEQHIGTSDPRLPDYAPVDTVVPWTPTEIEAMFDGEPVPNKVDYSYDPPEIEASEARDKYHELIRWAARDGMDECERLLAEQVEACDHDHVVTTGRDYGDVAYCEDCGRGWERPEFQYDEDAGNLTVVGEV